MAASLRKVLENSGKWKTKSSEWTELQVIHLAIQFVYTEFRMYSALSNVECLAYRGSKGKRLENFGLRGFDVQA